MQSVVGGSVVSDDSRTSGITLEHLKEVLDQWAEKAAQVLMGALWP
jgi:hypothetical protein